MRRCGPLHGMHGVDTESKAKLDMDNPQVRQAVQTREHPHPCAASSSHSNRPYYILFGNGNNIVNFVYKISARGMGQASFTTLGGFAYFAGEQVVRCAVISAGASGAHIIQQPRLKINRCGELFCTYAYLALYPALYL